MPDDALLAVRDLRVTVTEQRIEVVRGLNYEVQSGEALAIVGESGSGKSISVLSMLGLLPVDLRATVHGSVKFGGLELVGARESILRQVRGRRIGVVFQDALTSLDPVMRIGDQVDEAVHADGRHTRRSARQRSCELIELVGIPSEDRVMRAYPHQLSGGMRQRVLIAMALACDPELLIADEPTTALDATIQLQVVNLLQELRERLEMSLLLITHDLGLVAALSDKVLVMYAGKDVEQGRTSDVLTQPRHPYTDGLLASTLDPFRWPDRAPIPIVGSPPDLTGPVPACAFAPRCPRATDFCLESSPPVERDDTRSLGHYRCHFPILRPTESAHRQGVT